MNLFKDIPAGKNPPDDIHVVIDIPARSQNKYEYQEDGGYFLLDRVLHSPMFYPLEYGFVPQSHGDDGDALDVLVLTTQPTFPGCVIRCRPLGVLLMEDEEGVDNKIIAVPVEKTDPRFRELQDITDIPEHVRKEVELFFAEYKRLEPGGKYEKVKVLGYKDVTEARSIITKAVSKYHG